MSQNVVNPYRFAVAVPEIDKSNGLAYWNFEQQTGDLTNQATSGNGWSDGLDSSADSSSVSVASRSATGKLGTYSYQFVDEGTNQVNIPDQTELNIINDITITLWFNANVTEGNGRVIIAKRPTAGSVLFQIFLQASSAELTWHDSTNGSISKGSGVSLDEWHLGVCTISSGTLTIYLDGSSLGTSSVSTRSANSGDVVFGQTGFDTAEEFSGYIDDSSIWDRAWTSDEVTTYWNSGAGMLFN